MHLTNAFMPVTRLIYSSMLYAFAYVPSSSDSHNRVNWQEADNYADVF